MTEMRRTATAEKDRDFYRVLQVDAAAEPEVVEAAYRRLARKYHPDVQQTDIADTTERMMLLNAAYTTLRDPARRDAYDRERAMRRFASSTATQAALRPDTRLAARPVRRMSRRRTAAGLLGGVMMMAGGGALGLLAFAEYGRDAAQAIAAVPPQETVNAVARRSRLVFGPESGALRYSTTTGITAVELMPARINERNIVAEARTFPPYAVGDGRWDCGFIFRSRDPANQYRFILTSEGRWYLDLWENSTTTTISTGNSAPIVTDPKGFNDLRLLVEGDRALVYLNNAFLTALDVSRGVERGDVALATALYRGDAVPGRSLRYEQFSVLAVEDAPR